MVIEHSGWLMNGGERRELLSAEENDRPCGVWRA